MTDTATAHRAPILQNNSEVWLWFSADEASKSHVTEVKMEEQMYQSLHEKARRGNLGQGKEGCLEQDNASHHRQGNSQKM